MPVVNQDKRWAPHKMCEYCRRALEGWFRGEKRAMRFAIPRIWREPSNHLTDCYFCEVDPRKNDKRERKHLPSSPLTFRHLLHLYPTQKTCLCHNHSEEMNLS